MATRKMTYFSPKVDALVRFGSIWTAATMAGYLWIIWMSPSFSKPVAFLFAAIPSISLGWVFTQHSVRVLNETQKLWLRHTLATGTITCISTFVIVMFLWLNAVIS